MTEIVDKIALGKLYGGYRNPTTPLGHSFSTMKSAIQKYIRRGDTDKALRVAFELDAMSFAEEQSAKAHVTNFYNRLLIIFLEDISVASIQLVPILQQLFEKLLEAREKRKDFSAFSKEWCSLRQTEIDSIAISVILMCRALKSRTPSHYKSVYFKIPQHTELIKTEPLIRKVNSLSSIPTPTISVPDIEEEKGQIMGFIRHFWSALQTRDHSAVYWAYKISESESEGKYYRKRKSVFIIFFLLEKWVTQNYQSDLKKFYLNILQIYMAWFDRISHLPEAFLPWINPLIAILEGKTPTPIDFPTPEEVLTLIDKNYSDTLNLVPFTIDEWVYDMHTKEWKSKPNPRIYFANISSTVFPEDPNINKEYKANYIKAKYIQDGKTVQDYYKDYQPESRIAKDELGSRSKSAAEIPVSNSEKNNFRLLVRAQLVCGNGKTDTYYALDNKNKVVFVKGPFNSEEEINTTLAISQAKKYFEEIIPVKIERRMLIPDQFEKTVLGIRTKLSKTEIAPFLIFEDLCGFVEGEIPTKIKESKLWPQTEVVDWEKSPVREIYVEDINSDDKIARGFILALLFKIIIGINDLANRNFMVNTKTKKVYSVDEDVVDKEAKVSKLSRAMIEAIRERWNEVGIDDVIKKWTKNVDFDALKNLFGNSIAENMKKRLNSNLKALFD